jgi:putative DNA methylase
VIWDFAEINPASPGSGGWVTAVDYVERVLAHCARLRPDATVIQSAAQELPLPDNLAQFLFTDPPYFAAIPYGDLSEFFYVWLRPALAGKDPALFGTSLIERNSELIVTNAQRGPEGQAKDNLFFSTQMSLALKQCRRIVEPQGIGCLVFADASTDSWEAMLGAVLSAGWIVSASWPLEAAEDLALERVGDADHRAFGDVLVAALAQLLHRAVIGLT